MTDLKTFIHNLNDAWKNHRFDELYKYFHKEVVMMPPGSAQAVVGIEEMVESYRQFASTATIHSFTIKKIDCYERGRIAMCHVHFEVDYEVESGRFQEEGLEVYTIDLSGRGPKVLWRMQIAINGE